MWGCTWRVTTEDTFPCFVHWHCWSSLQDFIPLTLSGHLSKALLTGLLQTPRFSRLTTEQVSHKINGMLLTDLSGSWVNCSEAETWRALSTSWLCSTRALCVFNFWACEKSLSSRCPHSMSWLSKVKIPDLLVTPLALCTWKHCLLHHLCWEKCHKHLNLTTKCILYYSSMSE